MFTIGSIETYSEFQQEIERVLSIQDKKMRDISIAFLIKKAEHRYERGDVDSQAYPVAIETLSKAFKSSFLKGYFAMQIFYWSMDIH